MLAERLARHAWYHQSLPALFAETCAERGAATALIFDSQETSFATLFDEVQRLAQGLTDWGIGPGDVVSTLPTPTPDFAALYLATLQVGATVNPLNLLWGERELRGVLERNQPTLLVTARTSSGRDLLALLHQAIPGLSADANQASAPALPALRRLVCVDPSGDTTHGVTPFAALQAQRLPDAAWSAAQIAARQPTDIQFLCQTSGTTGLSKSAQWDHRPPLATVNFAARALGYTEADRYINLAPFYHNSGLFALNLNLVLAGTPLVLMPGFDPALALSLIERHQCTSTFGFDAHWQGMRRVPGATERRLPITKAIFAGEPRTYDLVLTMCQPGATLNNLYAQTENGPLVALAEHDCVDPTLQRLTHGRPLPGVQVVIKDIDTGARLPQGLAGEICYKSPFLFRGYLHQEQETRDAFDEEGYFHSGDYGHFDGGYVTFLGRLGGVVKSGGENVSTAWVSTLLLAHFAEAFDDVRTVGIPDDYWGTRVVSLVRPAPGHTLADSASLRAACKGALAAYEIPRDFLPWDGPWPVTAEGKIDFRALTAHASAQLASPGADTRR